MPRVPLLEPEDDEQRGDRYEEAHQKVRHQAARPLRQTSRHDKREEQQRSEDQTPHPHGEKSGDSGDECDRDEPVLEMERHNVG
jgi:hypothetical protein